MNDNFRQPLRMKYQNVLKFFHLHISTMHISLNINHKRMDILEYIGGRIVQKCSKKYPELEGKPDKKFKWITFKESIAMFPALFFIF